MRHALVLVLALLLGASTAVLAACGDSNTRGGIPASRADQLKSEIEDVDQVVDGGRCDELDGQLRHVDSRIDNLPDSVSDQLVENLRQGADRLRQVSVEDCNQRETDTQTQTTETPTVTEEVPTETVPVPTTTATTPAPTTTAPAPAPTTPAPDPGQGDEGDSPGNGNGQGNGNGNGSPSGGASPDDERVLEG